MEKSVKVSLKFPFPTEVQLNDNVSVSIHLSGDISQIESLEFELKLSDKTANTSLPITRHSDCAPGDCKDCHVVSCPVYMGYEDY